MTVTRRRFLVGTGVVLLAAGYENQAGAVTGAPRRHEAPHAVAPRHAVPQRVAAAVAYARKQSGKPYLWGGTGPDAFDCSGLVMMAYQAAGVSIPRTSQDQWKHLPRVPASKVVPGDLVFFAGSDGTWQSPGHVALVTGPHRIIQAYAPGVPIGTYPYGVPGALDGTGPGTVIGYTRPWA